MAVPVFGPIALDEVCHPARRRQRPAQPAGSPVKVLIITGDNVSAHNWKETSRLVEDILEKDGRIKVDITATPSKDLTDENLAKYDVLLLNYKETAARPSRIAVVGFQQGGISQGGARGQGAGGLPFRLECFHQAQLGGI